MRLTYTDGMRAMVGLPTQLRVENWARHGIEIAHHFSARECAVEARIPAGISLPQHAHDHDHLSVLASGTVDLTVNGETRRLTGPMVVHVRANAVHVVSAVTDAFWVCCHGVAAEDQADLEKQVIA